MASLQINCKSSSIRGPCALKIFGQVYRRSGTMLTKEEEVPTCLQTYLFDPEMQSKFRTDRYISEKDAEKDYKLRFDIFKNLYNILYQSQNAYLWEFFSINEFI